MACQNLHFNRFPSNLSSELKLTFKAVFEERSDFHRVYTLPFNTLVAVLDDGGTDSGIMENGLTHEIYHRRKGDLYFTPVNLPVIYHNVSSLHFIAIHFHLTLMGLDIFQTSNDWILEHSPEETKAIELAFRLPDQFHSLAALKECCLRFCLRYWPQNFDLNFAKVQRFQPLLDFIRNQATAKTKVSDLARFIKMRNEIFSREFSQAFHRTACDFLQHELTMKAISMLTISGFSVKETAQLLDFSNEFYFSKFFKRRIGCSPSEYRNCFRQKEETDQTS